MVNYLKCVEDFKECSRKASTAEPWEYKIINKCHSKMKNTVQKIFEMQKEKVFFDEIFSSNERCVQMWGACFSEIFNYDLQKSYELFLEESKSATARSIDVTGAKIAVERLENKLKNNQPNN